MQMEKKSRLTGVLWAVIAVLAITAGSLWNGNSGLKTEMAQLLDAQQTLANERDGLKTESQSQGERITALNSDVQTLQVSRDEQAAEVQRLGASAVESQQQQQALVADRDAQSQRLSQALNQAKVITSAREELSRELGSAQVALDETRARVAERDAALEQLQKKHAQLKTSNASKQVELEKLQQLQQDAQTNLQTLNAEKVAAAQQLAEVQDQVKTAASAGATLTRELGSAKQALGEAQASVAQGKTALAQLQQKYAQLETTDASRQAELKKLQQLQQDAQTNLQTLNAEKVATAQKLTGAQDQVKAATAAGEALKLELGSARACLAEAQASAAQQEVAFKRLQEKHARLETADLARQAELTQMQKSQQDTQQKLQARNAEKEVIVQKLAAVQDQAKAAVTAGASLSRELGSTKQTLDDARTRSAELNKSYEKLLKEHSNLAATDVTRQGELAGMRAAFEEAQNEVARLTGARGIYTVQAADSLSSIAAYFYRNGGRWTDIQTENEFLAANPDLIYAGQVLIIPK
jgi:chromosome segregation ATPase